ncbi:hypothetical protein FKW77_001971 [Venturia effusa]|uniref:Uncharacterized protein n=1 Tax=Venturia effusa TaxID=50376 RepID=A0A517LRJ8_9PEZI|nr:hypothetical protein FKW77_001971 [Venturia effusa]
MKPKNPVLYPEPDTGEPAKDPQLALKPSRNLAPHPRRASKQDASSNLVETTITKKLVLTSAVPKPKPTRVTDKQHIDIFEVPDDEESDGGESDDGGSHAGPDEEDEEFGIPASSFSNTKGTLLQHSVMLGGEDDPINRHDEERDNHEDEEDDEEDDEDEDSRVVEPDIEELGMPSSSLGIPQSSILLDEDVCEDGESQRESVSDEQGHDAVPITSTKVTMPDSESRASKRKTSVTPSKRKLQGPEPNAYSPAKRGRGRPKKMTSSRKPPTPTTPQSKTLKKPPGVETRKSPRLHPRKGEVLLALPTSWSLKSTSTPTIIRTEPTDPETDVGSPSITDRKRMSKESTSLAVPGNTRKRKTKRSKTETLTPGAEESAKRHEVEEVDDMEVDQEQDDDMLVGTKQVGTGTIDIDQAPEEIMNLPPSKMELGQILSTLEEYDDQLRGILARSFGPPDGFGQSVQGRVGPKALVPNMSGKQPYTTLSALAGLHYHDFPAHLQKSIDDIIESVDEEAIRVLFRRLVGHPSTTMANNASTSANFAAHPDDPSHRDDNDKTLSSKPQTTRKAKPHGPYAVAAARPQRQISVLRLNRTSSFGPSLFQRDEYWDYMQKGGLDGQTERKYEAARSVADKSNKSKDVMHDQLRGAFDGIAHVLQTNHSIDRTLQPFSTDRAKLEKALELLKDQTKTWTRILKVPKEGSIKKRKAASGLVRKAAVESPASKGKGVAGSTQTEMAVRGPAQGGRRS